VCKCTQESPATKDAAEPVSAATQEVNTSESKTGGEVLKPQEQPQPAPAAATPPLPLGPSVANERKQPRVSISEPTGQEVCHDLICFLTPSLSPLLLAAVRDCKQPRVSISETTGQEVRHKYGESNCQEECTLEAKTQASCTQHKGMVQSAEKYDGRSRAVALWRFGTQS